jgi:predicted tellurium resistance membrane protein TerC
MNYDFLIPLLTLTAMEIVLGVDNIIFISILAGRLPENERRSARNLGLGLALVTRLGLLFSISWIMGLSTPLFEIFGKGLSGRDLILGIGGLFLIAKATHEIHAKVEHVDAHQDSKKPVRKAFWGVIVQILLLDIVFSLDSVITAVGMVQQISIMVVAMVIAVGVMLLSAASISGFVEKHPTIKILALAFLILIGVMLLVESMGGHVDKGYIYFAMTFSFLIELINMRYRKNAQS